MNIFDNESVNLESSQSVGYGIFTITKIEAAEELTATGLRRIDFFLQSENGSQTEKFAVFLSDQPVVNKAGDKFVYVDKFGNFSIYTASPETQENQYKEGFYNFLAEGARKAFVGEAKLMSILSAVLNQTKKLKEGLAQNELRLSEAAIKALYAADKATIEYFNTTFVGRKLAALIMLKNTNGKKYTDVFEYFTKSWSNDIEGFFTKKVDKELNKDPKYSAIKNEHEFIVAPLGEHTKLNSRQSEGGVSDVLTSEMPLNNLPF